MAIVLYWYDKYKCEGVLNWPVIYEYDYDEEEEEEEADGNDRSSINKKKANKKKDSTASGMSFNSNVRSQKVGDGKTIVSVRSKRMTKNRPTDMQSDKRSMNSYMKKN